MNTVSLKNQLNKFGILMLTFFFSALAFAQEATKTPNMDVNVTTTKTTTTEQWYTNPIYWIIGGLFVIILIAIIARGNGRRD
ncbi:MULTISPECIES: hypothetical protein [Chryseobacterium]|uniref:Uncharacterized protein n=1 Tax=Chryseobacterium salivictor TaxID=2547600 RepID=A0A4P6ZE31_9FLAO|nr:MULTISPECIES: hypothetical protein [Chryseobacterium]MDQ0475949.1 hypothetical protein [Chryseobacterium sp. MDT2-18]QBO57715.1 hypothetical protein NBC122_00883 [Chryseobacterium salivictor]